MASRIGYAYCCHGEAIANAACFQLQKAIETLVGKDGDVIDVNGWMARTTLEMLGQAGLGYSFDNFIDDSTDAYGDSLKLFLCVQPRMLPVRTNADYIASPLMSQSYHESHPALVDGCP